MITRPASGRARPWAGRHHLPSCHHRLAGLKGERLVEITLTDNLGRPLRGATIAGKYFHHAHPMEGLDIRLTEDTARPAAGVYTVQTPLRRIGTWEFRLLIKRGPDEFILTRQLEVGPGQ